jgi:hypothetical protein
MLSNIREVIYITITKKFYSPLSVTGVVKNYTLGNPCFDTFKNFVVSSASDAQLIFSSVSL